MHKWIKTHVHKRDKREDHLQGGTDTKYVLYWWGFKFSSAKYSWILHVSNDGKYDITNTYWTLTLQICAIWLTKKTNKQKKINIPAIMSSTMLTLGSTCSMRPTSVLVCRFRMLFRRMAVNMLQISAWQPMSQCSNSSTMQLMLSASWIMKFVSKSNSPPTSCGIRWNRG